jgi:uncharacterized protein YbjT (DUF2867 family)
MADTAGKVALLAGANGMLGARLLEQLLASSEYTRTHALSRRPLAAEHPRLANHIVRYEALEEQLRNVRCDVAFCCLGTNRREARTIEGYRAIDVELVCRFAQVAHKAGAKRFVLVSSAGANAHSRNVYLRVKGEVEQALEMLRFPALDIFQPSLLLGRRRHWRIAEMLGGLAMPVANPLLQGRWVRWRAIDAGVVAAAMLAVARSGRHGVCRYTYAEIRALANPLRRAGAAA